MVTILQKNIMVNIDTVYQTVLAVANKEQRGYITPQEFNLYAKTAQLQIFEQYFYDINQFSRLPGNDTEYSDMLDLLNEKINVFETTATLTSTNNNNVFDLPTDFYRLGTVISSRKEVEQVNENELLYINLSPLAKPTDERPVYTYSNDKITVIPESITSISCTYVKIPKEPEWGYVVVGENAVWNPGQTDHFELHPSEQVELVNKILQLAGISMGKDIYQIASQEDLQNVQQEKA